MSAKIFGNGSDQGKQMTVEPIKAEEWPDDFWRAFEGMPEGFERPAQVRQRRALRPAIKSPG